MCLLNGRFAVMSVQWPLSSQAFADTKYWVLILIPSEKLWAHSHPLSHEATAILD